MTHGVLGEVRVDGIPVHLSETDWEIRNGAPLLGQPKARQVTMECHLVSMPLKCPDDRLDLDAIEIGLVVWRLVRDDHVKIGICLA